MENLSEKILDCAECDNCIVNNVIKVDDIKKFIRELKSTILETNPDELVGMYYNRAYLGVMGL